MKIYDAIPEDEKQLPETMKCIKEIEEVFYNAWHYGGLMQDYRKELGIKQGILNNPMLHLANAISIDCSNDGWSKDLAKYLCTMCGLECLDLKTERDYS